MGETLRKGSREYRFQRRIAAQGSALGRRLGPREAASLVRSLHSRSEQALLRRLSAAGLGTHERGRSLIDRVVGQLERGELEIWSVEAARGAGSRRERDEAERDEAPPIEPPTRYEVVIELVDVDNNPVPFEPYRIKLPDGRVETRMLDKFGRDRVTGIREAGQCMVCFHQRDAAIWRRA